jgi:phosphohistidine phosphatase
LFTLDAGSWAGMTIIMKSLYLLRHGKSSWVEHGLSDRDRPLAKRGLHDAPMMGERFHSRGEHLDRVISSPAVRAHTTAQLFCEACEFPVQDIETDSDLYFLGSGSIEDVILGQDDQLQALMLVFHNPDITFFANSLDDGFRIDNVPTSGLVRLNCDISQWGDWSRAKTVFEYFDYPKNLSGDVIRS